MRLKILQNSGLLLAAKTGMMNYPSPPRICRGKGVTGRFPENGYLRFLRETGAKYGHSAKMR